MFARRTGTFVSSSCTVMTLLAYKQTLTLILRTISILCRDKKQSTIVIVIYMT